MRGEVGFRATTRGRPYGVGIVVAETYESDVSTFVGGALRHERAL
jgi:hypothetical protein